KSSRTTRASADACIFGYICSGARDRSSHMRMTSIRLFLLAVLAFAGTGSALVCGQDMARMQYFYSESFGINEGLHHGVIADMRVDANGLLWMCTLGGLQVFDGMNFM